MVGLPGRPNSCKPEKKSNAGPSSPVVLVTVHSTVEIQGPVTLRSWFGRPCCVASRSVCVSESSSANVSPGIGTPADIQSAVRPKVDARPSELLSKPVPPVPVPSTVNTESGWNSTRIASEGDAVKSVAPASSAIATAWIRWPMRMTSNLRTTPSRGLVRSVTPR